MRNSLDYETYKYDAARFYTDIGRVYSPVFRDFVHFNAVGFNHIIFKGPRSEREKSSQILRFKLLPLAKKLIAISTTYQEYEESVKEFEVTIYKRRVMKNKLVRYWGVIAIIDGRKIKVILRKVGDNGTLHFWSIIPAWVTNHYRDMRFFATMKGNPDED